MAQHNEAIQPDVLVAAQQLAQFLKADGLLLTLGVNGRILFAEDETTQRQYGSGDHDDSDHAGPACGARGHFGHKDGEEGAHHNGTRHRDDAAVAGNLFQQCRVVGEGADGIRVHGGVTHRGEDTEC